MWVAALPWKVPNEALALAASGPARVRTEVLDDPVEGKAGCFRVAVPAGGHWEKRGAAQHKAKAFLFCARWPAASAEGASLDARHFSVRHGGRGALTTAGGVSGRVGTRLARQSSAAARALQDARGDRPSFFRRSASSEDGGFDPREEAKNWAYMFQFAIESAGDQRRRHASSAASADGAAGAAGGGGGGGGGGDGGSDVTPAQRLRRASNAVRAATRLAHLLPRSGAAPRQRRRRNTATGIPPSLQAGGKRPSFARSDSGSVAYVQPPNPESPHHAVVHEGSSEEEEEDSEDDTHAASGGGSEALRKMSAHLAERRASRRASEDDAHAHAQATARELYERAEQELEAGRDAAALPLLRLAGAARRASRRASLGLPAEGTGPAAQAEAAARKHLSNEGRHLLVTELSGSGLGGGGGGSVHLLTRARSAHTLRPASSPRRMTSGKFASVFVEEAASPKLLRLGGRRRVSSLGRLSGHKWGRRRPSSGYGGKPRTDSARVRAKEKFTSRKHSSKLDFSGHEDKVFSDWSERLSHPSRVKRSTSHGRLEGR